MSLKTFFQPIPMNCFLGNLLELNLCFYINPRNVVLFSLFLKYSTCDKKLIVHVYAISCSCQSCSFVITSKLHISHVYNTSTMEVIFLSFSVCTLYSKSIKIFVCQSADIMASLCGVCVCVNISSKSTRPRDMLLLLKDALSIKDDKS